MSSRNVETFKAAHQAFNRRDFDALLERMAPDVKYEDCARGIGFKGHDGVREFLQGWVVAFSDAQVSDPEYIDAGDIVVAEFTGRGVHDGRLGPFPPTGRKIAVSFCEILRFGPDGRIVSAAMYYDQLSMLNQLGLAQAAGSVSV